MFKPVRDYLIHYLEGRLFYGWAGKKKILLNSFYPPQLAYWTTGCYCSNRAANPRRFVNLFIKRGAASTPRIAAL
jgi:hypothetical protein